MAGIVRRGSSDFKVFTGGKRSPGVTRSGDTGRDLKQSKQSSFAHGSEAVCASMAWGTRSSKAHGLRQSRWSHAARQCYRSRLEGRLVEVVQQFDAFSPSDDLLRPHSRASVADTNQTLVVIDGFGNRAICLSCIVAQLETMALAELTRAKPQGFGCGMCSICSLPLLVNARGHAGASHGTWAAFRPL
jgi:hypothetical protein